MTGETLGSRLLAAFISVPVFELSLFLGFYTATGSARAGYFFFLIPAWVHVAYVLVAVLAGLAFGFSGITWLLGHLFLTHFERDRNERVTVALWAGIVALGGVGYLLAG